MNLSTTSITSPNRELHNQQMKYPLLHTNEYFGHFPSPPLASSANLCLIKQLSLFLELEDFLNNGGPQLKDQSDLGAESDSDTSDYEDLFSNQIGIEDAIEENLDSTKINKKDQQISTSITANLNSVCSSRCDRFKPMIPNYFFGDDTCQYLSCKSEPMIGREWVFKEIGKGFTTNQICILSGAAGTGKTKILQNIKDNNNLKNFNIIGGHYCLSDDVRSLEAIQFIQNLTWSLITCCHLQDKDGVNLFKKSLFQESSQRLMKSLLNKDAIRLETDLILRKCILEPLELIANHFESPLTLCFLIDGLDTLAPRSKTLKNSNLSVFLFRNLYLFPKWFKLLITIRNEESLVDFKLAYDLEYHAIRLGGENVKQSNSLFQINTTKDLNDYITYRINKSVEIQKNILYFNTSSPGQATSEDNTTSNSLSPDQTSSTYPSISKLDTGFQLKFTNHLSSLSHSSFLFVKLTLDLIEKGCLIIKSSNFKVLPHNIHDLFRLFFNLKFSSRLTYDRLAAHIFAICLSSCRPLTIDEIYDALSCAYIANEKLSLNDLLDLINSLDGFLISFKYFDPELDNLINNRIIMNDQVVRSPLYTFAHTAVREWWVISEHNTNNIDFSATLSKIRKPIYDARWGSFLLGMRLFRSDELNARLRSLEHVHAIGIYLDLIGHLIRSAGLLLDKDSTLDSCLNTIAYMLSLYMPGGQIYTSLLVSSEFLSAPNSNIFRVLVKLGADLNAGVEYFDSVPFICVLARLGFKHLLNVLVNEFGYRFQTNELIYYDSNRANMLSYATQYGHIECAKLILSSSVDQIKMLTQPDSLGLCPLTYLAMGSLHKKNNLTELLDYYIKCLTDMAQLEKNSKIIQQCLVLSAMNKNQPCLTYLINKFICQPNSLSDLVSLDTVDSLKGETCLTVACTHGHKQICQILVETASSLITCTNSKSWTPLLCAVKSGQWEIVEYLLSKNVKIINQSDKHGRDSLILAASEGHLAIIDILIEKGADLNSQDRDGLSALSWACLKGHYNAALTLLNNNVDINHVDFSGRTCLDLATFYGDVRLVQMLLERGAQIEHVDNIGMRPLDRAIGCRNVPIVVCFLKKGAKLGPATWAMAAGKPEIIITLLNKLVEDGNTLYRKGSYLDALHRYSYTLKKFPKDPSELAILPDNVKAIIEMKFNLMLNLARCHRKLQEYQSSIDLCTKAIEIKQDSYEAFYSRARAKRDLKLYKSALEDLEQAIQLCSTNNDVKKLISKINDEMNGVSNTNGNSNTLRQHKDKSTKTKT